MRKLFRSQRGEGDSSMLVGMLVSIMISIVVGLALVPTITSSIGKAKESIINGTTVAPTPTTQPTQEAINKIIIPNIQDPNIQLALLVSLLVLLLVLVFIAIAKSKKKEKYAEN